MVAPFAEKQLPTPPVLMDSQCGYLFVPENRATPKGAPSALPYTCRRCRAAGSDPVVHLAGGPGGSALIEIESLTAAKVNRNRELILISQRGTLFADPELCVPRARRALCRASPSRWTQRPTAICTSPRRGPAISDWPGAGSISAPTTRSKTPPISRTCARRSVLPNGTCSGSRTAATSRKRSCTHPKGIRTVTLDSVEPLEEATWHPRLRATPAKRSTTSSPHAQPSPGARPGTGSRGHSPVSSTSSIHSGQGERAARGK